MIDELQHRDGGTRFAQKRSNWSVLTVPRRPGVRTDGPRLWLQTKELYDHPLTIRRALDHISTDILIMHRDMKDMLLYQNEHLIIANELEEFAGTVLEKFMDITESDLGAFYLRNKNDDRFSPLTTIGVNPKLLAPFDAETF